MAVCFIKETTHKIAENSSTTHDRFRPSWGSSVSYPPAAPELLKMPVFDAISVSLFIQPGCHYHTLLD
ncbi:hypothetical protein T265_00598 [Opisthorchis viverrini]|uniref:Uncharacterized protein n=1 Tax=Opisthorchis viverrini TaxID=6198 RepID=A0A075A5A9_OPIVI|nr:hypothetical protein T265_00598 [Opisthorchis viverrini]KER33482.1 hypothetical protein T265_00598 [Opisthorchis viverrini]